MMCSVHKVKRLNKNIKVKRRLLCVVSIGKSLGIVDGKKNKIVNISYGLFLNQNQTHFRHKLKMFNSNNHQADVGRIEKNI